MSSNLTTKIYTYVWPKDSMRHATITFDATAPDEFRFTNCIFKGVGKMYDRDDWEFIGEVAEEVKLLCRKEGI